MQFPGHILMLGCSSTIIYLPFGGHDSHHPPICRLMLQVFSALWHPMPGIVFLGMTMVPVAKTNASNWVRWCQFNCWRHSLLRAFVQHMSSAGDHSDMYPAREMFGITQRWSRTFRDLALPEALFRWRDAVQSLETKPKRCMKSCDEISRAWWVVWTVALCSCPHNHFSATILDCRRSFQAFHPIWFDLKSVVRDAFFEVSPLSFRRRWAPSTCCSWASWVAGGCQGSPGRVEFWPGRAANPDLARLLIPHFTCLVYAEGKWGRPAQWWSRKPKG